MNDGNLRFCWGFCQSGRWDSNPRPLDHTGPPDPPRCQSQNPLHHTVHRFTFVRPNRHARHPAAALVYPFLTRDLSDNHVRRAILNGRHPTGGVTCYSVAFAGSRSGCAVASAGRCSTAWVSVLPWPCWRSSVPGPNSGLQRSSVFGTGSGSRSQPSGAGPTRRAGCCCGGEVITDRPRTPHV